MNCGAVLLLLSCNQPAPRMVTDAPHPLDSLGNFQIVSPLPMLKKFRGKQTFAPRLPQTYTPDTSLNLNLPLISGELLDALQQQLLLLQRKKQPDYQQFGSLSLTLQQLEATVQYLQKHQYSYATNWQKDLHAFQLNGRDGRGNVYFTGYYTPEIRVKSRPDQRFRYPIYRFPDNWEGALPTRQQIDGEKVLEGMGLEIAYTERLEDIYFIQLQGSGIVRFVDTGERMYLGYAGTNRHSYRSIGKYIKDSQHIRLSDISVSGIKKYLQVVPHHLEEILFSNPSYVFFEPKKKTPPGAGQVPLMTDYSVAVDTDFLPLGSCLLAAFPVLDTDGDFLKHEFRLLLAQDVGGAIRGPGKVDVYCGSGDAGRKKAMALHHYGFLWWLLPKEEDSVFLEKR